MDIYQWLMSMGSRIIYIYLLIYLLKLHIFICVYVCVGVGVCVGGGWTSVELIQPLFGCLGWLGVKGGTDSVKYLFISFSRNKC